MSKSQLFVGVMLVVLGFSISTFAQTPANGARTVLFKEPASARSFSSGPLSVSRLNDAPAPSKGIAVFLQFDKVPTAAQRQQMARAGIQLHEYIPGRVFLASVERSYSESELKSWGITGVQYPDQSLKKAPELKAAHPSLNRGLKKYHIWLAPTVDMKEAGRHLQAVIGTQKGGISEIRPLYDRMLEISVDAANLDQLLNLDFVLYAQEAPELSALNLIESESHLVSRLHVGDQTTPGLSGKDVTIGVGDAGRVYHMDLGNYQADQAYIPNSHATHVVGTLAGKGWGNPIMKGFAYNANLEIDYYNVIIYRTPELYQQKRMVITNNSYGGGSTCLPYSGQYSGYCGQVDQQLLDMPHLTHVFAAGNTTRLKCGDFPTSYRTIDNAFQAAKNVITVGGTNDSGTESVYAKGPTVDGRIKPEVVAISLGVQSTGPNNNYFRLDGTSMASPQVAGTLALLYERYRQLFGGADPEGDLMKALICNTATDMGTPYVDFAYGFGWLNAQKALETLNRKSWFSGSVEHEEETSFEIELTR
ncbi:MAG TPA: S8 family serine peptidase, partial [Flavihumibacter sp.]